MNNQGIEKDELQKNIKQLDYESSELNKTLNEILRIKKELDQQYINEIDNEILNEELQSKIVIKRINRENEIKLINSKISLYGKVTKETEEIFDKVKSDIVIE